MTTESETHADPNMPWQIPDDWSADLQSGHVIVAPATVHVGALSPRGYIVYAHDEHRAHGQSFDLDPGKLREAFGFLESVGYTFQGFKPWVYQESADQSTAIETETAVAQYRERLAELREAAEDDGIAWNEDSVQDFHAYISDNPYWRRAGLALMDNGNLRAVWEWEEDDETHLALQFLGNKLTQYVIFKRRPGAEKTSRVSGTDTFDGIKRQVAAFELTQLVHLHDKP